MHRSYARVNSLFLSPVSNSFAIIKIFSRLKPLLHVGANSFAILLFVVFYSFATTPNADPQLITRTKQMMGIEFTILVAENSQRGAQVEPAIEQAFAEIQRIDKKYSTYKQDSFLSKINHQSHTTPIAIDNETIFLLNYAMQVNQDSSGAFDITVESLTNLWNFNHQPFVPPTQQAIKNRLMAVGPPLLAIQKNHIQLKHPETRITLNAFGKGYAIDQAAKILKQHNINNFAVDGSGDLIVAGKRFGQTWKVDIQHPRQVHPIGELSLQEDGAVVTSGDYNDYVEYQGKRYAHIIDPRTGYPANVAQSVTVVAADTMQADALATALMVVGRSGTGHLLKQYKDIEVLIIDSDGTMAGTKRFQAQVPNVQHLHR